MDLPCWSSWERDEKDEGVLGRNQGLLEPLEIRKETTLLEEPLRLMEPKENWPWEPKEVYISWWEKLPGDEVPKGHAQTHQD